MQDMISNSSTRQKPSTDIGAVDLPYGVGASSSAAHVAEQVPNAVLHARIAGATPAPAVTVPKTAPPAA